MMSINVDAKKKEPEPAADASLRASATAIAKMTGTNFGDDAIGKIMAKYDADGDGKFDLNEVRGIATDVLTQKAGKKAYKGVAIASFFLILVLLGAMVGIVFGANEATKESHVNPDGLMTGLDGSAVKTEEVRSYATLYDLPRIETNILARLDQLTVNLAGDGAGAWPAVAQATFKVTSAIKPSDDELYLFLASGAVAHIDAANTTARVTLADGAVFSVVEDEAASSLRRELQETAEAGGATSRRLLLSKDEMQSHHRRLCAMSSGSFTMMASAGGWRRRLYYSCSLMTSGSFTMMASSTAF